MSESMLGCFHSWACPRKGGLREQGKERVFTVRYREM